MDVPRYSFTVTRLSNAGAGYGVGDDLPYRRIIHLYDSTSPPDAGRDLRAPVGGRVSPGRDDRAPDVQ